MTAIEIARKAGFDPDKAKSINGKGTGECGEIEVRTFRCRPWEYGKEAVAVEVRGCVPYSDGSINPVHSSWGKDLDVTLYFEADSIEFEEMKWEKRIKAADIGGRENGIS